jgi:hypothetical protein
MPVMMRRFEFSFMAAGSTKLQILLAMALLSER